MLKADTFLSQSIKLHVNMCVYIYLYMYTHIGTQLLNTDVAIWIICVFLIIQFSFEWVKQLDQN